ncbi:MAG: mechanosensitive ion channel [Candidatus Eremiobacteraeota bacterium]|nr:mechanosensitive ion channel [Candidatus Eremiobacteraeota bacterium]
MNLILAQQSTSWLEQLTFAKVAESALIVIGIMIAVSFLEKGLEALASMAPRSRFFFKTLVPIGRFSLWLLGGIWLVSILAPTKDTVIALTASFGIAVGFGSQDLVKNLIGGLIILTDRPYQLGDRVQIGSAYGEIDHIGLRSTKMTNADDTRITIPNGEILTAQIWNSNGGVPDAQVSVDLYLDAAADPYEAMSIGYEAAYSSPYLLAAKPVVCLVADQVQQWPYLRLRIKGYVYDHRFEPRFQSDITARAKCELKKRGMLPRMGFGGSSLGDSSTS